MNTYTKAAFLLFAFTFISCDKDYNTLGSDIIGDEHFDFKLYDEASLNSYIKPTGPIQTNNLPINALGIYNNPAFGTTKAHFVSQIEMVTANPSLGYNHYIDSVKDSVYVYIPFFSTLESTSTDGESVYVIDSLQGDSNAKFNLKVYENGYFLRDFDPNDNNQKQKYFSDFKPTIDSYKGAQILNNASSVDENTQFFFNKNEIIIYETNGNGQYYNSSNEITTNPDEYVVKERKIPGIWLNLNKSVFKTRILDAVSLGKLYNNNTFKQYFKGLYFEAEEINPDQGSLVKLDLSKAEIVVQYHYFFTDGVTDQTQALKSSLKFQMGYSETGTKKSNSVNLLELSNINANYANALLPTATNEKLFLKGGVNGTVAYIDLFGTEDLTGAVNGGPNGIPDELDNLRANNWLINEANLVFYIDQTAMSTAENEPLRIYLYDAIKNKPLLDYYSDPSVSGSVKYGKFIHGGIIEKNSSGKGTQYKIRITDYINNILNGTNPNTNGSSRLGLVVTENINYVTNANLKTPIQFGTPTDQTELVPMASVINTLGTVLHGSESTATSIDENGNVVPLKLKLQIYYTEPK